MPPQIIHFDCHSFIHYYLFIHCYPSAFISYLPLEHGKIWTRAIIRIPILAFIITGINVIATQPWIVVNSKISRFLPCRDVRGWALVNAHLHCIARVYHPHKEHIPVSKTIHKTFLDYCLKLSSLTRNKIHKIVKCSYKLEHPQGDADLHFLYFQSRLKTPLFSTAFC